MKNELKLIRTGTNKDNYRRFYLYNGKYIDVYKFNNILDNWYYMGYDVKKYDMHRSNQHIYVYYTKEA